MKGRGGVLIDAEKCTGCGLCVAMCPKKILRLDEATGKCGVSKAEECDRLRGCVRACPAGAISID